MFLSIFVQLIPIMMNVTLLELPRTLIHRDGGVDCTPVHLQHVQRHGRSRSTKLRTSAVVIVDCRSTSVSSSFHQLCSVQSRLSTVPSPEVIRSDTQCNTKRVRSYASVVRASAPQTPATTTNVVHAEASPIAVKSKSKPNSTHFKLKLIHDRVNWFIGV